MTPRLVDGRPARHGLGPRRPRGPSARPGLSRIPLFGENRDDILGILYAKDLFPLMTEADDPDAVVPRKLVRPAYFVPETKNANDLLERAPGPPEPDRHRPRRVRRRRRPGHARRPPRGAGRPDRRRARRPHARRPGRPPGRLALRGRRRRRRSKDLNDRLGLHLPTDGDFQTVGGFAFNALGRLPAAGETFRSDGVEFTVVEVVDHSIRRVQLDLVQG